MSAFPLFSYTFRLRTGKNFFSASRAPHSDFFILGGMLASRRDGRRSDSSQLGIRRALSSTKTFFQPRYTYPPRLWRQEKEATGKKPLPAALDAFSLPGWTELFPRDLLMVSVTACPSLWVGHLPPTGIVKGGSEGAVAVTAISSADMLPNVRGPSAGNNQKPRTLGSMSRYEAHFRTPTELKWACARQ
jgi:hypothetical protein